MWLTLIKSLPYFQPKLKFFVIKCTRKASKNLSSVTTTRSTAVPYAKWKQHITMTVLWLENWKSEQLYSTWNFSEIKEPRKSSRTYKASIEHKCNVLRFDVFRHSRWSNTELTLRCVLYSSKYTTDIDHTDLTEQRQIHSEYKEG